MLQSETFPFVFRWDSAPEGVADFRFLLHAPAGSKGFIRVGSDGHFYAGNRRIRFWGMNLTAGANFLSKADAPKVAERLARTGFNLVRCHHMDAQWSNPALIEYGKGNSRSLNPEALDALDFFFAELKKRGLYADLNLVVNRRFFHADGLPAEIDSMNDVKEQHVIGFFYEPIIKLQKEYARQLLTHKNPYTGLTYIEDPAVAMVEINNEGGLIQGWYLRMVDRLPGVFQDELRQQWNEWLMARYQTTEKLRKSWGEREESLGEQMLGNPRFEAGLEGWILEQHGNAQARAEVQQGAEPAAHIRVLQGSTADWHVQFNQSGLRVKAGQLYTLRFRAKADRERTITVNLQMAHEPWQSIGLSQQIRLTTEWQTFETVCIANQDDSNVRVNFSEMGRNPGEYRFAELELRPGGKLRTLPEGDVLSERRVGIILQSEWAGSLPEAQHDWMRFLWETEQRYWRTLYRYLKEELKVRVPVIGTIVSCSTPNLMAELDAVDTHAYWQHPEFPGNGWSDSNWFVRSLPMVNHEGSTIRGLTTKRVLGKPHMVTEYNHPAPNQYNAEGFLFAAAYGALQDWDAMVLYTYNHRREDQDSQRITGFFDIDQHAAQWSTLRACAALFLREDVKPAKKRIVALFDPERELEALRHTWAWRLVDGSDAGLDGLWGLTHRLAVATDAKQIPADVLRPDKVRLSGPRREADTGEIVWDMSRRERSTFVVRAKRSKIAVGFIKGHTFDLGDGFVIRVTDAPLNGFGVFTMTVREEKPRRHALITLVGHAENTGWNFRTADDGRVTVGNQWGQAPVRVSTCTAELTLPAKPEQTELWALDPNGKRLRKMPVKNAPGGKAQVQLSPQERTVWYELVMKPR
jgi:hypothetical protein